MRTVSWFWLQRFSALHMLIEDQWLLFQGLVEPQLALEGGRWWGAVAYLAGISPLPACESVITSLAVWHVQTCRPPAASRALADTDQLLFLDSGLWNPAVILARDSSTIQKACSLASNWHHPSKTCLPFTWDKATQATKKMLRGCGAMLTKEGPSSEVCAKNKSSVSLPSGFLVRPLASSMWERKSGSGILLISAWRTPAFFKRHYSYLMEHFYAFLLQVKHCCS